MSTYLQNSEGTFIPATKRPDGTWRKARRVKDGYVPQEEVPLYESKGKQFAQRQTGVPPGMCPFAVDASSKEREKLERAKAKKLERKATKNSNTKLTSTPLMPTASSSSGSPEADNSASLAKNLENGLKLDAPEIDAAKQMKKLRKKIREIELIEDRIKAGELKKLDKDQLDKVKKKSDILKQIQLLEESST